MCLQFHAVEFVEALEHLAACALPAFVQGRLLAGGGYRRLGEGLGALPGFHQAAAGLVVLVCGVPVQPFLRAGRGAVTLNVGAGDRHRGGVAEP